MEVPCPVCGEPGAEKQLAPEGRDCIAYSCIHCGGYELGGRLLAGLLRLFAESAVSDARHRLSHAIRKMQKGSDVPILNSEQVEKILTRPLPTPTEQADILIRWLGTTSSGPGLTTDLSYKKHGAIMGSSSEAGFVLVVRHLLDEHLIEGNLRQFANAPAGPIVTLSFRGWERFEQLKTLRSHYGRGFVAMKFGDPVLDGIIEVVFKPAALQTGFQLFRLDDNPRAGLIDDRLRVEIRSSDFIIADLSHDNPGAYWEAGYAEGLGIPVIYACEWEKFEKHKTHFDTNHHLTIRWNKDDPNSARDSLKATIRATLPHLANQRDE